MWFIGTSLKHALLPPLGLAWLVLFAWLLLRRRPRAARWLLAVVLVLGYLACTPASSGWLMARFVLDSGAVAPSAPQAIVVLGGGRALSFDAQGKVIEAAPSSGTLERLFTAARLQKQTGLPLLVTGGKVDGYDPTEGIVMRDSLENAFGVKVRWVEGESRNTVENASFSAPVLRGAGVHTIFLVTSDYHLRRSRLLFEAQGFAVTPVAALSSLAANGTMLPAAAAPFRWRDLIPNIYAAEQTFIACNEIAGTVYARFHTP